jgi:hypothetical protein
VEPRLEFLVGFLAGRHEVIELVHEIVEVLLRTEQTSCGSPPQATR